MNVLAAKISFIPHEKTFFCTKLQYPTVIPTAYILRVTTLIQEPQHSTDIISPKIPITNISEDLSFFIFSIGQCNPAYAPTT